MTDITPIHNINLPLISENYDIRIKRDDLYPKFWGGNKARKIVEIGKYAISNGYDTLVTNGGVQSNHCRATAMFCAQNNLKCRLVLHTDKTENKAEGNYMLNLLAGADISFTQLSQLSNAMDKAMLEETEKGCKPFYIWGGGHLLEGSLAYYHAFNELKTQCLELDWIPDYIVFPSGTGTTQAGIHVGNEDAGWKTKVIGISISREKLRGKKIIEDSCKELREHFDYKTPNNEIIFLDDYMAGGYEKYNKEIIETIKLVGKSGVFLDPTYTGKAFWGLRDLMRTGTIQKGSNVLFWHTGGLFNLLTSNGF